MQTEIVKTRTLCRITNENFSVLFEVNGGKVTITDWNGKKELAFRDCSPEELKKAGETLIKIAESAQNQAEAVNAVQGEKKKEG